MFAGLVELDVAGYLVLFIRIPFVVPQQGQLAGKIADALQIAVY